MPRAPAANAHRTLARDPQAVPQSTPLSKRRSGTRHRTRGTPETRNIIRGVRRPGTQLTSLRPQTARSPGESTGRDPSLLVIASSSGILGYFIWRFATLSGAQWWRRPPRLSLRHNPFRLRPPLQPAIQCYRLNPYRTTNREPRRRATRQFELLYNTDHPLPSRARSYCRCLVRYSDTIPPQLSPR